MDPDLIATIIAIESCGNPYAKSEAGAIGLMQVMPFNFKPDDDHTDPRTNIIRGIGVLLETLRMYGGDLQMALAGYNYGIGNFDSVGRLISATPAETQYYVTVIIQILQELKESNGRVSDSLEAMWEGNCIEDY